MPFKPVPQPTCARCSKAVYPTEKFDCLGKTWHKGCFDCAVCHTKLTQASYRGFENEPYCKNHYPSGKFTAVADTPETLRLKAQQERQSVVAYHKAYEADKGKYQGAAEGDRNTQNAMATSKKTSNINYSTAPSEVKAKPSVAAPAPAAAAPPKAAPAAVAKAAAAVPKQPEPEPEPVHQPEPEPEPVHVASSGNGKSYKALYDYAATDEDEVPFSEGDIVTDVEVIDEGWVKGTVNGKRGMLPSNYIDMGEGGGAAAPAAAEAEPDAQPAPEDEPEAEPEAPAGEQWVALYDYAATDGDEVSFAEKDIIVDIEVIDDGWVKGTHQKTGNRGLLPSNYIEKQ